MLLTNVFRMLIKWRSFNRAKKGTTKYQALMRGRNTRRTLAAVKTQTQYRMYIRDKNFRKLKSAILALQCAVRFRAAKSIFHELMKEQKDVGKLKQNNEKLKQEMASLRAMLSAQAKESAASDTHKNELAEKQKSIDELERRVAEIERELEAAKKMVEKLESDLVAQKDKAAKEAEQTRLNRQRREDLSPDLRNASGHRKRASSGSGHNMVAAAASASSLPEGMPVDYISPEVLAEHRSRVATLEEELEAERTLRRQADGEIIKLRAAINGVKLNDEDVSALLAPQLSSLRSEGLSTQSSFDDDNQAQVRYVYDACWCFCAWCMRLRVVSGCSESRVLCVGLELRRCVILARVVDLLHSGGRVALADSILVLEWPRDSRNHLRRCLICSCSHVCRTLLLRSPGTCCSSCFHLSRCGSLQSCSYGDVLLSG